MSGELLGDSLVLSKPEVSIVIATAQLHVFLVWYFPIATGKKKKRTGLLKTWIQDFLNLFVITKTYAQVQDEG